MIFELGQTIYYPIHLVDAIGNPATGKLAELRGIGAIRFHDPATSISYIASGSAWLTLEDGATDGVYDLVVNTGHGDFIGTGVYYIGYQDCGEPFDFTDGQDWVSEPINVVAKIAGASLAEIEDVDGMLANTEAAAIGAETAAGLAAADASAIAGKLPAGDIADADDVSAIGYQIAASAVYASGTLKILAALERNGDTQTDAATCTVTVYDSTGTQLFTLTDAAADARGVFSVSKASPGLSAGNVYYALVAITDAEATAHSRVIPFAAR